MTKSRNHSDSKDYIWKEGQFIEKDVCFDCGSYNQITYHHVVPEVKGGTRALPLCIVCHGKVHGKDFLNHKELQRIGIEKAKNRGVYFGRKAGTYEGDFKFLSKDKNMKIILHLLDDLTYDEISKKLNVSTTTVTKVNKVFRDFENKDSLCLDKFRKEMNDKEKEEIISNKFEINDWMTQI
jgi:predicted DNA-binding protein YlxM (UPF0122 family)